jgi:hypothetical protein
VQACSIVEKEGTTDTGLIPFTLWPAQAAALETLQNESHIITVKGRQIGITWLELALMLYQATFWDNRYQVIVRQSLLYAKEGIRRIVALRSSLPAEWKREIVSQTATSITFDNACMIECLTASEEVGRSIAAYHGVADEFAFWPWPETQLAALDSGCHRLHIITTGNGPDDVTYDIWCNAQEGRGQFKPIFIPSSADPRRNAKWRRIHVDEAAEPRLAKREHAETPEDAFAAPSGVYFERWLHDRNVAERPILPQAVTWRCVDFGFRTPAVFWAQRAPNDELRIIWELIPHNITTSELADRILQEESQLGLHIPPRCTWCDPAGRGVQSQTAESEFEIFQKAGLTPLATNSSIRDGCVRMTEMIADPDLPLIVHPRCKGLIRAIGNVRPHHTRAEVYDYDHDIYSHPLDALRYLIVNVGKASGSFTEGRKGYAHTAGLMRKVEAY